MAQKDGIAKGDEGTCLGCDKPIEKGQKIDVVAKSRSDQTIVGYLHHPNCITLYIAKKVQERLQP